MNPFDYWRRRRDLRRRYEAQEDRRLTEHLKALRPTKEEPRKPRVFPTRPRRT